MKKLIFFILSTVFVLAIPKNVFASTSLTSTGTNFYYQDGSTGSVGNSPYYADNGTRSLSYFNIFFGGNIPDGSTVVLSFSEDYYYGANYIVNSFNSTNFEIQNVTIATASESGHVNYTYWLVGTKVGTSNYITLTHGYTYFSNVSGSHVYTYMQPLLTYYDANESTDNILADILAQQQTWATQTNTYLGYVVSNLDSIRTTDENIYNQLQQWATQTNTYLQYIVNNTDSIVSALNDNNTALNNINDSVNNVNDSINNDSVSTNTENSSTAESWASQSASDSVVSDMVLMPITLLTAFSNGFSGSCQAYNLGSLYGTDLTLPCINIQNYLGSTLWGIIDVLMSGFLIYGIGKKFVKVFNDFTNLKDSQVDELYGGGSE